MCVKVLKVDEKGRKGSEGNLHETSRRHAEDERETRKKRKKVGGERVEEPEVMPIMMIVPMNKICS
jgi:hypothetical protein